MPKFNIAASHPPATSPVKTEAIATGRTHKSGTGYTRDAKSELFLLAITNMVGENTYYEQGKDRDPVRQPRPLTASTRSLTEAVAPALANPAIKINITATDGPLSVNYDSYIRGGGNLGPEKCTSNFNLIYENDTTNRRLGTAGHCTRSYPTTTYCNQSGDGDCTTVHAKWSYIGPGGDVGMYDHGSLTATRTFYWDWSQKAYVDSVSSGPQMNQSVCKFGFASGYDCGTVVKLNHSYYDGEIGDIVGGQVLTSILNGSTRCTFTDSGGPFFRATSDVISANWR